MSVVELAVERYKSVNDRLDVVECINKKIVNYIDFRYAILALCQIYVCMEKDENTDSLFIDMEDYIDEVFANLDIKSKENK